MPQRQSIDAPVIGITSDVADGRYRVGMAYASSVAAAGGTPVMLGTQVDAIDRYLDLCHGFVLTGGDDPDMSTWGELTHPKATPLMPERQAFEVTLLRRLAPRRDVPALGVCLGMQLMALEADGRLDQYLPDTLPTWRDHWQRSSHRIEGLLGAGEVHSHHRQAVSDPGRLSVVARAHDGVIEAVRDDSRAWWLGVQWHAERTDNRTLGQDLFDQLVEAARGTVAV